jgi:hypothetical protein
MTGKPKPSFADYARSESNLYMHFNLDRNWLVVDLRQLFRVVGHQMMYNLTFFHYVRTAHFTSSMIL